MTVKILNKATQAALGRYPLFWARFESTGRTVTSGFGLYAETGHYENGTPIQRRLCVAATVEDALTINDFLCQDIWDPSIRRALRLNLDRVADNWRRRLEK